MNGTINQSATRSTKNNTSISSCPESFAKWYCLNGATCFSVKIRDSTLYNCWCPIGFNGLRCDYKYVHRRYQEQSSSGSYDQPASGFPATHLAKEVNNRANQHETLTDSNPQAKESHLTITYNMLIVLSILLIIVFALRTLKRRGIVVKTIGTTNDGSPTERTNAGQMNQTNNFAIEFGSIKQGQQSHHYRSRAQLQMLESRQLQQHSPHQTHWMASVFTPDHQRRCEPV